jgi:hypothetical protein
LQREESRRKRGKETQAEGFAARLRKLGKRKGTVTAKLDWEKGPGIVWPYQTLNAGTTNSYVFRCDTEY